jgi:L-alanine-DL-glutamate epimerase-like enolase superfamily enzyme
VLSDAKHGDHTHFELVTVTVHTSDGLKGTGYTYTGGKVSWGSCTHDLHRVCVSVCVCVCVCVDPAHALHLRLRMRCFTTFVVH